MTVGVIMMVAGEAAFNAIGFSLIIASAFFSGFRWALTQILLLRHPATSNPFATLFFIAPIEFVALFLLALAAEGPLEVINGIGILIAKEGTFQGICLLIFPGFLAFCMLSSEFALLQRTNVVTLSICGIFKEVVTISAAEIFYHDPLTPINISGLLVTIASIGAYNYLKVTKMRREARKKVHAVEAEGAVRDSLGGGDDEERQGLVSNSDPSGGLRRTESPSGSNRSSSPPKRTRDLD
ncbi:putative solute carrier family 35 member c2 [Phaeomoniella chlamydospora]|uniref:Putative solute carrier family 35 member c2 n=1 Tax=Phaeomoniella chlamydospora TaxID=158046 RepID=A0A0G2GHC6_PHACM|nr:putative solute carrier family 35 member c2 [Phaeomoniella chlamydospora]